MKNRHKIFFKVETHHDIMIQCKVGKTKLLLNKECGTGLNSVYTLEVSDKEITLSKREFIALKMLMNKLA